VAFGAKKKNYPLTKFLKVKFYFSAKFFFFFIIKKNSHIPDQKIFFATYEKEPIGEFRADAVQLF
jgi:hypothetical protein